MAVSHLNLLYDWYTEVYENPNRRVQISCVIVHFETRLNQFLKWAAGIVVCMKNGWNYFVSKYLRRREISITIFWVISLFQHRCSVRAGKQHFQWRKRIANFIEETKMTTVQINKLEKRNLTWVCGVAGCRQQSKMTSTDLRRAINAPTWAYFNSLLQKEMTSIVYNAKRSSSEWFILSRDKRRNVCT